MKRTFSLLLVVLFFLPSIACGSFTTNPVVGSGVLVNQQIDVSNFDRVTLEAFGTVFIEQGQTESLSVQTDENIIPLLDVRVQGSELILGIKKGVEVNPSQSITYNLTVQHLNNITLAGSGTFHVGSLKSGDLTVSIPGSGDVNVEKVAAESLSLKLNGSGNITLKDVHAKTIDTSLRGSGDIKLDGKTDAETIAVSGSGNYLAGNLQSTAADISIPGSGNITVWVEDTLHIHISGSGNISYYGDPVIDQNQSGSGDLTSLGEK